MVQIECMDLSDLRKEYSQSRISYDSLLSDPILQFELWFKAAQEFGILESNAMTLATVSAEGIPSVRTVLLKYFDKNGMVFFTNYTSTKAKEMNENPNVALLFPWITMERQVKIIGTVEKITRAESLKYFLSRPKDSQIGAWVSDQSSMITSRKILMDKFYELKEKFQSGSIPIPDFWGGYRVIPTRIEFWQGGEHRLHDRFLYLKNIEEETWKTSILAP